MRFGTHSTAIAALAILLAPALWADDTAKSATAAKKDEASNTRPAASKAVAAEDPAAPAASSLATARTPKPAGQGTMGRSNGSGRHSGGGEAETPKVELFLGYSYWRAMPYSVSNRIESMHGGSASLAYNFTRHVGLVADFAGFGVDSLKFSAAPGTTPSRVVDADGRVFSFLVGPRYSFRSESRFTPFLQVLAGAAHAGDVSVNGCDAAIYACKPLPSETAFALTAGGGLDWRASHRIALRLFQAEYLLTRFQDPSSATFENTFQHNVRLSAGIVFRFGGEPPPPLNHSPTASCSADKTGVYAESGDAVMVRAEASDPDSDPLSYSWNATGGAVEGNGPAARWNSSGTAVGTYTVSSHVNDGRGGSADCSVNILVEVRPNRPPTVACMADRSPILQGEGTGISANANDPDNDTLSYSYTATGGRIVGSGPKVRFESNGVRAGRYTIKCMVDDNRGGLADAVTTVEVQVPPPPPEVAELESRLALHSIYFQTARPSVQNPGGGLLESQEKILAALATDFQRYLTFRPEAHLILAGHADVRGTPAYNKALTERRVERAKGYLTEHGVPSGSIEVRALGEEQQLTSEQVEQQMKDNPDLTPQERQRLLANLPIIVLANNRRVDITLSTTGQQSLRRYPFNARDALSLLSTKGVGKQPATKKRPPKQ